MTTPHPSFAQAISSCLRHAGLRATWCRARFGDRTPWKELWEAAFSDDDGNEDGTENENENENEKGNDAVDRHPLVVRLATSPSARERVQVDVCGPRCVGPQCLVAATELDAALGRGDQRRHQRQQPLRAALAALLADIEDRHRASVDDDDDENDDENDDDDSLLLVLPRHRPDGNLPPPPAFPLLESQRQAVAEIDAALSSEAARFVSVAGGGGGGKATAAAAAARAFLSRARGSCSFSPPQESNIEVSTSWDKCFWLDARGIEDDDGEDEQNVDGDGDDGDPTAAAFRALLAALGGSSVPGASDRDRVLLRARALFGDGGGVRGGLIVRLGGGEQRQPGLTSALLELLGAARGLSVVAVGGEDDDDEGEEERDHPFFARVTLRSLSEQEARSFLQRFLRDGSGDEKSPSSSLSSLFASSPPLRDVRVLRAIAGLRMMSPSASPILEGEEELERYLRPLSEHASSNSLSSSSSSPSSSSYFLASLLVRGARDPKFLLSLSRVSRSLLSGLAGTFSVFAAAAALNCDCEGALKAMRSLEGLGLVRPAETVPSSSTSSASASSSSSSSLSSSYWTLGSLASSAAALVARWIFIDGPASTDSLASLARVSEAASATVAASLEFARGGARIVGDGSETACCSGGSALASHWVSRERALFSSAVPLARLLCREATKRTTESTTKKKSKEKERQQELLATVALSSLSKLLWSGGDKLLPGILGFRKQSALACAVERAAVMSSSASAEEERTTAAAAAAAARAAFSLGAALCARGRWNEARAPLLRSLERSDALAEGSHRIASMMARVEYKSRGDLSSAADLYAKASSSSSSPSSPSPVVVGAVVAANSSSSSSSSSNSDALALEQEAEALEGAAGLLRHAGREADALACYRSSLAARAAIASSSRSSSSSSPSSSSPSPMLSLEAASTANNAAVLLASAGARLLSSGDAEAARRKFREADILYSAALRAREGRLGGDDPSVASALFNSAALAARRGDRALARERLQRAASVRELALGEKSSELAEAHTALALWSVVRAVAPPVAAVSASGFERATLGGVDDGEKKSRKSRSSSPSSSPSSSLSLCLSRREARAHARAALSIFEELEGRCEAGEQSRARQQRRNAIAQLKRFLQEEGNA